MENTLTKLQDLLTKELDKIADKGDITPAELQNVETAMCVLKKVMEVQDIIYEDGYSKARYSVHGSYRRGRDHNTGRYVSRHDGRTPGHVEDGYSQHSIKDRMIANLESMMDSSGSDYERETIEEWINRLESEK